MGHHKQVGVGLGQYEYRDGPLISRTMNLYYNIIPGFMGCAWIYRAEVVREVGGFDENIKGAGEDMDLLARIQEKGWASATIKGAAFFHNYRVTLKDFWCEQSWFGYGSRYLANKFKRLFPFWRNIPPASLIRALQVTSRAYRSTHRKTSFFIPPLIMFGNMAWICGFLRAFVNGYGAKSMSNAYERSR